MKQFLRIIAIVSIIGHSYSLNGQSLSPKVIPTNGGYATGGGNSLSWTMGETFNTTLTGGGNILTQGEQQPELDLTAGNTSATLLCTGNSFSLPYTATGYYGNANVFTAQLSNATGSFSSAISIGSVTSTMSGTITCTIPAATPAGNNYRVRVISNHPTYIGKMSNSVLTISNAPPSSAIHFTAAPATGCVGITNVLTINQVTGATFYNWTSTANGVRFNGQPGPFQTTTPTVNVTFVGLPAAGTSGWSICVFGGNACGNTNTICTWVRATISMPGPITGNIIGCPGSTLNPYSVGAVAGAVSYQWSGTAGITINGNGAQNVTVDFSAGFVSGVISVHGQTSCGYNGPDRTFNVSRAPATPGTISGTSYPCPNSLVNSYSVAAVPGAANYTWSTSVAGAVVTGTTNTCNIAFPAVVPAGSAVSVVANSSCPFPSAVRSKGISSGIPNTPGAISGPAAGQCGATGVSYSISPVALATGYSWSVTCGTIVGPANLSAVSVDWPASFTSCAISVSATNACGTGTARSLVVTGAPAMPTTISGNTSPCANAAETYATVGSAGATSYIWTVPAGCSILGPINGASIIVQWGGTNGSITVKGSNSCGLSPTRSLPCVISCRISQVENSAASFNAEIFPNPATGKATVKFTSADAAKYHLDMTDVLGQNVLSLDGAATEGINMVELNLGAVAKGIYVLSIMSNGNTQQMRLVIE